MIVLAAGPATLARLMQAEGGRPASDHRPRQTPPAVRPKPANG